MNVESTLRRGYLVCSALLLLALVYHLVAHKFHGRSLYAVVSAYAVLYFGYYYLFRYRAESLWQLLKPIFYFNLAIVILFYLGRFEFGLASNDFKVGFTYGNFWDFYFQALTVSDQTYKAANTGYFPFAYAISKLFAFLGGWRNGLYEVNGTMIRLYVVYLLLFLSPMILLIQEMKKSCKLDQERTWLLGIFVVVSYPFLFAVERGNFAIVSFFFLALMAYFYQRGQLRYCAVAGALLLSVKLLNIIFLLFLIRRCRKYWREFLLVFAGVSLLSLIYLFGFDYQKWAIFKLALLSPLQGLFPDLFKESFVVTDGGRLQGMTSIDSFRVLLKTLVTNATMNATTNIPVLDAVLMLVGVALLAFFYLRCARNASWQEELIIVLCVVMAFHSGAAEYNLLLLLVPLAYLAGEPMDGHVGQLMRYVGICLMLSGGVVLYLVALPEPSGFYNSASPKSFLVPFGLVAGIVTILANAYQRRKTVSASLAG